MKSVFVHSLALTLCAIPGPAVFANPLTSNSITSQKPLTQLKVMSEPENTLKVPGHNNATYGPIPKASQLFHIEFFEIAPSTIPVNQIIFLLLRGRIPPPKETDPDTAHLDLNTLLTTATLSITLSAVLADGTHEEEKTYTVPLRTTAFNNVAHLAIRSATGDYVEYLSSSGSYDILFDAAIPGMFVKRGMWTFKVVAEVEDGGCLFAMVLKQWLEGGM